MKGNQIETPSPDINNGDTLSHVNNTKAANNLKE